MLVTGVGSIKENNSNLFLAE